MASSGFNFKQFHVAHDRCAMKVGTDGVLLGAWAGVAGASRVLDVGCGSGLITLMVAQRTAAHVVGVEIDAPAAEQAIENVAASPWAHRIEIVHADVSDLCPDEKFDHIVSNPPFFCRRSPSARRSSCPSPPHGRSDFRAPFSRSVPLARRRWTFSRHCSHFSL